MKQNVNFESSVDQKSRLNHSPNRAKDITSLLAILDKIDFAKFDRRNEIEAPNSTTTSTTTSFSDEQLYDIARSIIALNVSNNDVRSASTEQDDSLTKLLHVCQTIIDFLLTNKGDRTNAKNQNNNVKDYQNNSNNNNNNLLQENAKLRKLLTLQQKAIAFRRASITNSYTPRMATIASEHSIRPTIAMIDEDASTSAAIENLPQDSESLPPPTATTSLNGTRASSQSMQCIWCPKVFTDANSFLKHLSLRHLSSSIVDNEDIDRFSTAASSSSIGCGDSGVDGSTSFIERLQKRYNRINVATDSPQIQTPAPIIDQLQSEIVALKAKLSETERTLRDEQSARRSFEDDLKGGLVENVRRIQEQLLEKIEEVKFARNEALIAADQASNANRNFTALMNTLNSEASGTEGKNIVLLAKAKQQLQQQSQQQQQQPRRRRHQRSSQDSELDEAAKVQKLEKIESKQQQQVDDNNSDNNKLSKKCDILEAKKLDANETIRKDSIENYSSIDSVEDVDSQEIRAAISSKSSIFDYSAAETNEDDDDQIKQSLRRELISRLTSKRSERNRNKNDENNKAEQMIETIEAQQTSESANTLVKKSKKSTKLSDTNRPIDQQQQQQPAESLDYRETTKAEIHWSLESRLKEYLQLSATTATTTTTISSEKEGLESISALPKVISSSHTSDDNQSTIRSSKIDDNDLNEDKFANAMNAVQRDRQLLIEQSRHDYDFRRIESALREIVDSKIRSKLERNNEQTNSNEDDDHKARNGLNFNEKQPSYSVRVPPEDEKEEEAEEEENRSDSSNEYSVNIVEMDGDEEDEEDDEFRPSAPAAEDVEEEDQIKTENVEIVRSTLRSILKSGQNWDHRITKKSNIGRRISFSDQVMEYPISPRSYSSDSDDDDDDDSEPDEGDNHEGGVDIEESKLDQNYSKPKIRKNQMFVIRSIDDPSDDTRRSSHTAVNSSIDSEEKISEVVGDSNHFVGEKIYLNQYESTSSSSSSSSSDEDDDHHRLRQSLNVAATSTSDDYRGDNGTATTASSSPQAAPRRLLKKQDGTNVSLSSSSTLDSLLLSPDEDVSRSSVSIIDNDKNNNVSSSVSSPPSSSRVHELAELIERKLQSKSSSESGATSATTGSINAPNQRRLPPIGSIDTLASLRYANKSNDNPGSATTATTVTLDQYDIYDF